MNTIYHAELLAIKEALMFISEAEITNGVIVSDSKSSLDALNGVIRSKYDNVIYEVKQILFELENKEIEVKFLWVPSHEGIEGNEQVDKLAKEALTEPMEEELTYQCTELGEKFKRQLLTDAFNSVSLRGETKGKVYFKSQKKFKGKSWFDETNLNRQQITLINRIRSGHSLLKKHLFDKNIIASAMCECGESEMDIDHVVWNCNNISMIDRIKLLSACTKRGIAIDTSVQKIFLEKSLSDVMVFVQFILNQKSLNI